MSASGETLYIKGERNVEVKNPDVTLGDLLTFECSNKAVLPKIKTLRIMKIPEEGRHRYVISILKIIACIHEVCPGLEIQNLGETDLIVTYEEQKTTGKCMHIVKTILVMVFTFVGAGFSIMAFNNDISVTDLFDQLYKFVVGTEPKGLNLLEIAYSAGILIGVLLFFNHMGKRRFTVDPSPLEVQMRLYENDIQTTLMENASRREDELDVGKTTSVDTHRT